MVHLLSLGFHALHSCYRVRARGGKIQFSLSVHVSLWQAKMFWQLLSGRSCNLFSPIECLILFFLTQEQFLFNDTPIKSRRATETVALCTVTASQCQGTGSVKNKGASNRQKLNRSVCSGGSKSGRIELGCQYRFNGAVLIHWQSAIRWNKIRKGLRLMFSSQIFPPLRYLDSSLSLSCSFPVSLPPSFPLLTDLSVQQKLFNDIHMFMKDVRGKEVGNQRGPPCAGLHMQACVQMYSTRAHSHTFTRSLLGQVQAGGSHR